MNPRTHDQGVVQLRWKNGDGLVTIEPENQDRYNLKVRHVIEACEAAVNEQSIQLQIKLLLKRLGEWIQTRADVRDAIVTLQNGRLLFLVIRNTVPHDPDFEDSLSALDLAIANDPDLGDLRLDALALPPASPESIQSFSGDALFAYRGR